MNEEIFRKMTQSILDGDDEAAVDLARKSILQGISPQDALTHGFLVGLNRVGEAFSCGEVYLPELVMAGEAMKSAFSVLEPEMKKRGIEQEKIGKVILATVEGDIHEIGKTLVGTMLSASGFQVFDLGVDIPATTIVSKVIEESAQIVALSALLTTTMIRQEEVVDALEKAGLRPLVKVMIGGAPVSLNWMHQIGADGYSEDAFGAVSVARRLMEA